MHLISLVLALASAQTFGSAGSDDAARANLRLVTKTLASTTAEWSPLFAESGSVYVAPRILFLEPARRHPSRGFGYSKHVGLIVDLGEMQDVRTTFKGDADALIALIIAHEVGHHVQHLVERHSRHQPPASDREQEADCAAGWWLRQANRRSRAATGEPLYRTDLVDRHLPRLFRILARLKDGLTTDRDPDFVVPEAQRLAAFARGLSHDSVAVCGPGITPVS